METKETKILLDTNFLLIPAEFRVDIFSELERLMDRKYKLYILDKTITELKNIVRSQKGKSSQAAKIALQLIDNKKLNIINTSSLPSSVDDIILRLVNSEYIVGTQDKLLRKKLKQKNIQLLSLRQKTHLRIIS